MKSYLIALTIIFCSCVSPERLENSLLWKISGNGLTEPSYLFGTLHAICDIKMTKALENCLNDTQQVYFELDINDPDIQKDMNKNQAMKDGVTLDSLLSEKDFALLDNYFIKNKGRSVYKYITLKPEFINTMLVSNMQECETQSYEEEIAKIAKKAGKEIFGLEKINDQMAIFDTIPYEVQAKGLMDNIRDNLTNGKQKLKKVYEMYKQQDIEGLENSIRNSNNKTYSSYYPIILANRNKKWVRKIEQEIKIKPTLFAVGVSHLAGDEGVIKLLRKKGYKVEAIK